MTASRGVEYVLGGLLLVVVGSIVLGQVIGQPVLFSYVETGSMEPMLRPNDGFVAIPMALAGPVVPGDVIVFDAENLNGGNLVTHRVVGTTDSGYITKGDANPVTDQDSAEPPVQDTQIVAKALQIGGTIVVIPKLGLIVIAANTAVTEVQRTLAVLFGTRALLGPQGLAYVLFGFGVVTYAVTELIASNTDATRRRTIPKRQGHKPASNGALYVVGLTAVLILLLTASMTVPGGEQTFDVVSSSQDAPGIRVIESGTEETVQYRIPSNGVLPVVAFLEPTSEGIRADPPSVYVPANEVRESILTISAPSETGYYTRSITEHRYIAVLPVETIEALYRIHPWAPILVIDALVGLGFAGIGVSVLYGSRRVRSRELPVRERLHRWWR
ncbi:signal peptidase I [Halobellus captivus]|uniref:signal peptidase I n=1 Tax=Halobellus captivus TaxID=2592614 RepID=UPI0011A4CC79|nr:signal peptidase I [Halobellus captivus]